VEELDLSGVTWADIARLKGLSMEEKSQVWAAYKRRDDELREDRWRAGHEATGNPRRRRR
jgi:hypothetical protein